MTGEFPRQPVGVLELNRKPANYHPEVEQAALSPSHMVPGMGYSPDKMLQARLFAYHDAQRCADRPASSVEAVTDMSSI